MQGVRHRLHPRDADRYLHGLVRGGVRRLLQLRSSAPGGGGDDGPQQLSSLGRWARWAALGSLALWGLPLERAELAEPLLGLVHVDRAPGQRLEDVEAAAVRWRWRARG